MYKYTQYNMKKKDLYKIHCFNMWQQDRRGGKIMWKGKFKTHTHTGMRTRTHAVFLFVVNEK